MRVSFRRIYCTNHIIQTHVKLIFADSIDPSFGLGLADVTGLELMTRWRYIATEIDNTGPLVKWENEFLSRSSDREGIVVGNITYLYRISA